MNRLIRTKGNLLDMAVNGDFDIIVHGCNCFNTMGSGIALQIKNRFNAAWKADDATEPGDYNKLGNYSYAVIPNSRGIFVIVNAYTQVQFGGNKDHFEYESFAVILKKLAYSYSDSRFGFPYIGMGLAGGDASRIISMLEDFSNKVDGTVTLVEYG